MIQVNSDERSLVLDDLLKLQKSIDKLLDRVGFEDENELFEGVTSEIEQIAIALGIQKKLLSTYAQLSKIEA